MSLAALVRRMAGELADCATACTPSDGARLAGVAADLAGPAPADARQRTLMVRIQAFIDQRLAGSCPLGRSRRHHIEVRTLHRLFANHGLTVGGWIRERPLERCRRELAGPRLATRYIDTIARRWAFTDGSHLSNAFKSVYGISPAQWRASTSARH